MHMHPEAVYVLNRRVYKESSLILDVFSLNYGRLSIIAKGALKSKNGWSALLQAFQPLLIVWTGRSSLKTLVSVDAPSKAVNLSGKKLFSAYYLNELLLKLIPQEEGESQTFNTINCFAAYSKTLELLVKSSNVEPPLRMFEFQLLNELGVFPDPTRDLDNQVIMSNTIYKLIYQEGFKSTLLVSLPTVSKGELYIEGRYLIELSHILDENFEFYEAFLKQIKRLMRALINQALGGQVLKSRSLFQTSQAYRNVK